MQVGQLEAFLAVVQYGSISRAAERLFLTQPTVTSRIRQLEIDLKERLFTRVKYGVTLTDAGKVLLPYAQRALQTLGEGRSALENLREAAVGNLFLGSSPFISTYLLPVLLERFASRHPRVHVAVRTGHSEEVLAMVLSEEVQIGLVRSVRHPDVESVGLYDDELVLVVHPSHPFSSRLSVTIEDVAHEGIVSFDRATSYYELVNRIFVTAGLAPKARLELDNVEAAKKMVEKGLGIALLPRIAIEREVALGAVKAVPIVDSPHVKQEMVAIYRRASGLGGIAQAFLQTTRELPVFLSEEHGG